MQKAPSNVSFPTPTFLFGANKAIFMLKVGDLVERIGILLPQYMKNGIVIRVIPNKDGLDWFTEYEVNFSNRQIALFYETQLRLLKQSQHLSEERLRALANDSKPEITYEEDFHLSNCPQCIKQFKELLRKATLN